MAEAAAELAAQLKEKKEPEVFETPDVPDAGPVDPEAKEQKKSEDIIESDLRPQLAFEKFAGKLYDTSTVDFSDSTLRTHLHLMSSREREFAAFRRKERHFETPLQRYNRLKDELHTFKADLDSLAEAKQEADDPAASVAGLISKELTSMDHELQALLANKLYEPHLQGAFEEPSDVEEKSKVDKMLADLHSHGAGPSSEAKADSTAAGGRITYELYYNPKKDAARQTMNLSDLDRRIASIEKTLGQTNGDKALGPDVSTALSYLQRRLDMLDQNKLDAIGRRIKSLVAELETLEKVKSASQSQEQSQHQEKIAQIYSMMQRWDDAAQQLPAVIARLQSLKELHEESAAAVLRIQAIDSQATHVDKVQKDDQEALKRAEQSLVSNAKVMEKNAKALEARFKALEAKIAKLA